MYTFEQITQSVNEYIDENILQLTEEPEQLYAPIKYTLSNGGKRLRPVLCLMAANLFADDLTQHIHPAIGLEVFHNFTLLHDDIMDKSDIRRNKPTVHKKWDENTAILSGDAMLIKAYQIIAQQKSRALPTILDVFNQTAMEVCEGQQYDMEFENREDVTVDEYLKMIKLKTSVLLAASLKIGAISAGASVENQENLYNFGLNLGLAFQLQDDYLDVYGDIEKFGKKTGSDIVNNKKTFLLISALEKSKELDDNELINWIQTKDFDKQEKINAVKAIYNRLNIAEVSKQKILSFHESALHFLSQVQVKDENKNQLIKLAEKMLVREN